MVAYGTCRPSSRYIAQPISAQLAVESASWTIASCAEGSLTRRPLSCHCRPREKAQAATYAAARRIISTPSARSASAPMLAWRGGVMMPVANRPPASSP
ncbi:hypothetical protein D9M69_715530 [compost metagenome]